MRSKLLLVCASAALIALLAACTASPDTTTSPSPAAETEQIEVAISNFAFDPETVAIKTGTTLKWVNEDGATHTVTSDAGDWDSGNLNSGSSYTLTLDQTGTFTYHCNIHPGMTGTIEVTE